MFIMKLSSLFKNSSWKWFIKFCLLWLVLACFWLTSFSSAIDYTCNEAFTLTWDSLFTINSLSFGEDQTSFEILDYDENIYFHFDMMFRNDNYYWTIIKDLSFILWPSEDYWIGCQDSNASFSVVPISSQNSGWNCPTCPTCEDCSSCQSSLGACLEDNISLENMNESLSSELESCLENSPTTCVVGVDTGCVEWTVLPLLSWSVGLDSFTTPIINNLTLPQNYKWKLVDWVLTISSINNNLSISDSDIETIKDSLVEVVLCIFGFSLFLVLIYYIKFYIFNSKK